MPRTYQPRSYGLVNMPAPPDPVQSLSGLMALGSNLESFEASQREGRLRKTTEAAFAQAKGNLDQAATLLEQQGEWAAARNLRDNAQRIRQETVNGITERLGQHKTVYGRGAQALREIEAQPDAYGDVRPQLVELASALDPRLAAEIPETYDPEQVRGMLQFVEAGAAQTETRLRAVAAASAAQEAADDALKRTAAHRTMAGEWLSASPNQEDWDASLQGLRTMGVSDDILSPLGDTWSPEAQEKARQLALTPAQREPKQATSIEGALLAAHQKGDQRAVDGLMTLQRTLAQARQEPKTATDPAAIQAVLDHPGVWGDLNPEARNAMLPHLARAGFDFTRAANTLTEAQKAQIERWRADTISALNADQRDPQTQMDDAAYQAELARIEASYQVQMGSATPPPSSRVPAADRASRADAQKQRALPPHLRGAASGAIPEPVSSLLKGQKPGRYTLSDGSSWTVAADGTIAKGE